MRMAQQLAAGPRSLGMIRRLYWEGLENTYAEQLAAEAKYQSAAGLTADFNEGVAAFRDKRPPSWKAM